MKLTADPAYVPTPTFSASGLSRARRCLHAWGLRYLLGMKKPEITWGEASALVKPVAKVKSRPTPAERLALKKYNSKVRPALGKECHSRLETYYRGGAVDWYDRPGNIAIKALEVLPHPDVCDVVEAEGEIEIEIDGVKFRGFRDLLLKFEGSWLLVDYKTTFSFEFFDREKTQKTVKTPAQLQADPQANLYAFAVMRREGLAELACRWVYLRTEGGSAVQAVDFVITREAAAAFVAEMVAEAKSLTARIVVAMQDRAAALAGCIKNPDACGDFGGCEYHHERDGDCAPPTLTPGEKLVRLRTKEKARAALPPKPERTKKAKYSNMGFRDKGNKPATTIDTTSADAPEQTETDGAEPADEAPEAAEPETTAPAAAPAPAPKKPKPASAPAAAAPSGDLPMVSFGGVTFPVPSKSPLFKPLMAAAKAQQAFEAALAGE